MDRIRDFYDERFRRGYRAALRGYEIARWFALRHFIVKIVGKQDVGLVLDYGSGIGLHLDLWKEVFPGARIHFCDLSSVALDSLKSLHPEFASSCALVENNRADFEDGSFDVVVSVEVMEHVENHKAYLADVYRLLKPGGVFIWTTPCANALSAAHIYAVVTRQVERTKEGCRRWRFEDKAHLRRLKTGELKEILAGVGFLDVDFRFRAHVFSFFCDRYMSRRMTGIGERLMMLDYSLFRRFPNGASMLGCAWKSSGGAEFGGRAGGT